MRGLWVEDGQVTLREDLASPVPGPGEVRVRVLSTGVCATDLALRRGYMGFRGVPGHEFVGEALEGPLAGERVVGEINLPCRECPTCAAGLERHCPRRTVLGILNHGGAFAEELTLPAANLHPVPPGVSTEAATFTEPLAAAFEIVEQVDLAQVSSALVLGDGRLGLLCAQVLALHVERVELLGRHPDRAARVPAPLRWTRAEEGRRHDLVVEASGSPDALARALTLTRPRGTVVLKTTCERPAELDLAPLVIDEITLVGSRCGPFAPALAALENGTVAVEPMIDARLPLSRGAEAFDRAARSGVLKVLVSPDPSR